ncbi:MAG: DUF5063 domain-containing protein [Bacillota bacterium]
MRTDDGLRASKQQALERFAAAAERVVALAESGGALDDLQAALSDAHSAFLALPEGEEVGHAPPDEDNHAASRQVYERWRQTSPRLADALAGAYRDFVDGLELYRRGTPGDREAALWAWQSLYWQHWGGELLLAQQAIHRVAARERFDRAIGGA